MATITTTGSTRAPRTAGPQGQDPEALHKALRAEREAVKAARREAGEARERVARMHAAIDAQMQPLADRVHKLEQLLQRLQADQVEVRSELRSAREESALLRRQV